MDVATATTNNHKFRLNINRLAITILLSIASIAIILSASYRTSTPPLPQGRSIANAPDDSIRQTNDPPTSRPQPRNVLFLNQDDWTEPQLEAYSGMWWQSLHGFLSTEWVGFIRLEDASFFASRHNRVVKTKDWLDFSVTHLSIFYKHFEKKEADENDDKNSIAFAQLEKELDQFVQAAKPLPILESAAPDTIAVLPFFASRRSQQGKHGHSISEKAMLVTLVSLWESGIARCVVVCGSNHDAQAELQRAQAVVDSFQWKLKPRPMDVQFIVLSDLTYNEKEFMPETALRRLQLAFRGNFSQEETNQWLGEHRRDWKFVYFSEPDTVLHARPTAMKALKEIMEAGKVLSGHRFDVIPHEDNFPGYDRLDHVLPRSFVPLPPEIDIFDENLACCDTGRFYPANWPDPTQPTDMLCPDRTYYDYWWLCGFRNSQANYNDPNTLNQLHAKLRGYHLLRFRGRLPYPLVEEHQHICNWAQGGNCAGPSTVANI